jgi:hypothetical protein
MGAIVSCVRCPSRRKQGIPPSHGSQSNTLTNSQIKTCLAAIGSALMAIVNGIGAILMGIINGIVMFFDAIISCCE